MRKTVHLSFSIFSILLIIGLSLANAGTVLADEDVPTDVPTAEPTEPPAEETPEPEASLPTEEASAAPVPDEPTVELLADVPENTDVVVLDENGNTVTLASQTAAEIVEDGDPMWCPAGTPPGGDDCTTNYGSISQLIAELTGSNIGNYEQDGVIYFTAGASGGSFTLTSSSIGGSDFGNLNDYNLTLQGGWDGEYLDLADFNGQTNFGNNTVTIGSSSGPSSNQWSGNVTINNITFNNVAGTSLGVYTTGGDITLSNVDVTYTNPGTNQNNNYNVILDSSGSGDIVIDDTLTIGNGSSFDNGTNGAGLFAETGGDVTITGAAGQPITFTDANGSGSGTNYNGATLDGDVVTLTNVTATNNDLNGIFIDNPDVVILNNVVATNNGTNPPGSGTNNTVGSGVNVDGGGGPDTVVVVNGGNFSDNEDYGLEVSNSSIIVQNAPTCSGNNHAAGGTGNCFDEAPVNDSSSPNTTINSGPNGTVSSTTANFGFSGTDNLTPSNGLRFECRLDGAGFTSCSSPVSYSGLAAGSHTFQVRARDLAGNVDLSPASRTWSIDNVAPTITITLPAPNGSNGWFTTSPVNGTVTASDNIRVNNLSCSGASQGTPSGLGTPNASRSISISGSGTHNITCTATDSANGSAQSTATVKIDTTAPAVLSLGTTPSPTIFGWNNSNVTANWLCVDLVSGNSGQALWTVSQVVTSEGANQSAIGTCQNNAGLTSTHTQTGIDIDKTAPAISGSRTPANTNGWNNGNVAVSFTCFDALSGVNTNTVAGATVSAEGAGQSVTNSGTCTDRAGNTASPVTISNINIDKTAPTATATAAPAPNPNGWNNTNVVVTFSGNDALSGIDFCSSPMVLASEAAAQGASGTCTDRAGNVSSPASAGNINIDMTAPVLALPANAVLEAASAAGTSFTYSATVTDNLDNSVSVNCLPASGTTFARGVTTVNCSSVDQAGNTATGSFTVTVRDTTAPTLTLPANITEEAISPTGNVVTFTATASDIVDGSLPVTCTPASNSTFAITTTTVTCSATDAAGNTATDTFTVTIEDTTAPTLSLPADITEEAVGPAGNVVTFTATSSDIVDGSVPVICAPASGSTFAITTTTVSCSATDAAGNSTTDTFTVTIEDTTAPTLSLPADITEEAVGPAGNVVTFTATSSDIVDGSVPVICTPASGSTFAIATTTVSCSATDEANNTVTGTFTVTVQDTTAPIISRHADVFAKSSNKSGEEVWYGLPTTSDIVDGSGVATCSPAPGKSFGFGDHVIMCTAVDAHGNVAAPITFVVHVIEQSNPDDTGADLVIPVTGGSNFMIDCQNPDSFLVETQGAHITFNNLCGYDALVEGLESASLPGRLPSGASFLGGFTIDVLKDGTSVDPLPKNASIVLEFDLEGDFDVEDYSALAWNGTAWVEVTGEKTADGNFRITLTEGGTFIIVKK